MGLPVGKIARELGRWIPPAALRHAGQPAALFFHGIEHETGDPLLQMNHHTVEHFRAMLSALTEFGFQVLPLEAINDVLAKPDKYHRSLFLMSDDGYRNTLTIAADILDEYRMPWSLFVSTAHIGTNLPNPIFLAWLFFLRAPDGVYRLPHFAEAIGLGDRKSRVKWAQFGADHLRFLPAEKAEETIAAMRAAFPAGALQQHLEAFSSERFLDWDEVRALHRRGVTIGAHADTHWPMHAAQSESYLRQQAAGAKALIEQQVGPCRFFAYPFGNKPDVGAKAWQAVRDAGFSHAFTTMTGSLAAGGNPWLLPRYGLGPQDHHIASLVPLLFAGNGRLLSWQAGLA